MVRGQNRPGDWIWKQTEGFPGLAAPSSYFLYDTQRETLMVGPTEACRFQMGISLDFPVLLGFRICRLACHAG